MNFRFSYLKSRKLLRSPTSSLKMLILYSKVKLDDFFLATILLNTYIEFASSITFKTFSSPPSSLFIKKGRKNRLFFDHLLYKLEEKLHFPNNARKEWATPPPQKKKLFNFYQNRENQKLHKNVEANYFIDTFGAH